jgi:hypothetical protein
MDELATRLGTLCRRSAAALERRQGDGVQLVEQFQRDFRLLIAQYGEDAVEAAINGFRARTERPLASLH